MDAKQRRELYRQESNQRHAESFANREDTGRFRDIFEPEKKAGVTFWKDSQDDHEIYIVPYVTGKQDPSRPEGRSSIALDVYVHRGVGVSQDSYVCLLKTYGKKCPICEYQAELRDDPEADEKEVKALNASRRSVYNIVCLDTPRERDKGVQVWPVSQFKFTIPLEEMAHKKKGGGNVLYADIDQGKVISFRRKGVKMSTEYTAFEFKDREVIPDAILEAAVCLDELVHVPTYEEVYEAFWATKDQEAKETEAAAAPATEERKEKEIPTPAPAVTAVEKEKDVPESVTVGEHKPFTDCPNGAAFGTDYNQYQECKPCEARKDCRAKLDEIEEAKLKEEEAKKKAAEATPAAAAPAPGPKKLTRKEK